jgi:heme-degrading monooxygenase HmoA
MRHDAVHFGEAFGMEPEIARPVVTVFRSRLRREAETNGYGELAARMEARARAMPGFVDFKTFTAPDGERVSVVVFDTIAHQHAWRDEPEHRVAQRRGRDAFYSEYTISVCQELDRRSFQTVYEP